jgi:hypothetical protein
MSVLKPKIMWTGLSFSEKQALADYTSVKTRALLDTSGSQKLI